jgi:hypothetical protein
LRTLSTLCHRYALWIKEAPEPSDIKYESMEHGMWDRALRAALVAVASYTALGLGFLLISLATTAQVCGVQAWSGGRGGGNCWQSWRRATRRRCSSGHCVA